MTPSGPAPRPVTCRCQSAHGWPRGGCWGAGDDAPDWIAYDRSTGSLVTSASIPLAPPSPRSLPNAPSDARWSEARLSKPPSEIARRRALPRTNRRPSRTSPSGAASVGSTRPASSTTGDVVLDEPPRKDRRSARPCLANSGAGPMGYRQAVGATVPPPSPGIHGGHIVATNGRASGSIVGASGTGRTVPDRDAADAQPAATPAATAVLRGPLPARLLEVVPETRYGRARGPVRRAVRTRPDGTVGQGGSVAREVRRPAPGGEVSSHASPAGAGSGAAAFVARSRSELRTSYCAACCAT